MVLVTNNYYRIKGEYAQSVDFESLVLPSALLLAA
jgi:hypothetical protein